VTASDRDAACAPASGMGCAGRPRFASFADVHDSPPIAGYPSGEGTSPGAYAGCDRRPNGFPSIGRSATMTPGPDSDRTGSDTDDYAGPPSDPEADHAGPRSDPDDVYTENEEGDPGLAGRRPGNEGVYGFYPEESRRVVDPVVYGALLVVGLVLILFPEPFTSVVGLLLVVVAVFVAAVDLLS